MGDISDYIYIYHNELYDTISYPILSYPFAWDHEKNYNVCLC